MPFDEPIMMTEAGFPYIPAGAHFTDRGTPYLTEAGVAMIARSSVDLSAADGFLGGFGPDLGFGGYLADPDVLPEPERLVKFLGQACYLSLGAGRTPNAEAGRYLDNLKRSGHGSVYEHPVFTLFFWGIDRSVTHELVRHRAGFGFSQVSQRYVDGTRLRFVERPEYQEDGLGPDAPPTLRDAVRDLHLGFLGEIDGAFATYEAKAASLIAAKELGHPMLAADARTEARKQVNQVAREGLPNCTEAPIGVTGNARAWRHAIEMRANAAADVPIRLAMLKAYRLLRMVAPLLFGDYEVVPLPSSRTAAVQTPNRKI
jgi:thymidylate synthase (FAD)